MQGEVDFRERLLLLDGANSIVEVLGLVHFAGLVVLHGGRLIFGERGRGVEGDGLRRQRGAASGEEAGA